MSKIGSSERCLIKQLFRSQRRPVFLRNVGSTEDLILPCYKAAIKLELYIHWYSESGTEKYTYDHSDVEQKLIKVKVYFT